MLVWVALALSLVGLTAGSLLVAFGTRRLGFAEAIGGLTAGAIPILVATRLLPHLDDELGVTAWILAVAGYCAVVWAERRGPHFTSIDAAVLLPALAVHSAMDGAALALAFGEGGGPGAVALGGALVLHRLPEGLLIGSVFVPRVGVRRTLGRLAWLAAGTFAGAISGRRLVAAVPGAWLHGIIALALGIMVRLVVHRHDASPDRREGGRPRPVSAWAFCAGVAAALAVPSHGDPRSRIKFAAAGLAAAGFAAFARFHRSHHPEAGRAT
jgi:uncharacterized protein